MQRDIEYVYMVYKTRSFSKAAKVLFASQPAVSMAVRRVEEEFGYIIFERNTHPLQLTKAGEMFVLHLERVLQSEKILRDEMDQLNGVKKSMLRIGCTPMHGIFLLPGFISKFCGLYPDIEIKVLDAFPQEINKMLRDCLVDIAISTVIGTDNVNYVQIPAFCVHYLLGVPSTLPVNEKIQDFSFCGRDIISGKYLKKGAPHVPLSVFADTPFIMFTEGTEFYDQSIRLFEEAGFKPKSNLTVFNPAIAHKLAAEGNGAAIVDNFSVSKKSPLNYYKLQTRWDFREFFFVLRKEHVMTEQQKLFMKTFITYMKQYPIVKEVR